MSVPLVNISPSLDPSTLSSEVLLTPPTQSREIKKRTSVSSRSSQNGPTPVPTRAPSFAPPPPPPSFAPDLSRSPRTRKWVPMGSEDEIRSLVPNRDLIKLSISRKRREFGVPCKFSDRDAHDGLVECRPFKNPMYDLVMRETEVGCQGVPQVTSIGTQTTWFRKVNAAVQYESIEMDERTLQNELAQRTLSPFMARAMESELGRALVQNGAIDLFRPDLPPQVDEEDALLGGKADNILKEIQSFTDLQYSKNRVLACVDWMPGARGIVAVACSETMSFDERVAQSGKVRSSIILIWNFVDPIHPQAMLETPNDVTAMRFHPTTPTTLVAGCVNGQILYYDLANVLKGSSTPLAKSIDKDSDSTAHRANVPLVTHSVASSIEASHRTTVHDLVWLAPSVEITAKNRVNNSTPNPSSGSLIDSSSTKSVGGGSSSQFLTSAPDGQILVWDIRFRRDIKEMDLLWAPIHRISLTRADLKEELTISSVSLGHLSYKMVAATEEGEMVYADWGPYAEGNRVHQTFPWHHGPIKSLERSPFFDDIILTVGDWTAAVWREGGTQPLLSSPHTGAGVAVGRWSPTRPGVFFVARVDGTIDVWDLLDKAHLPTLSQHVAPSAIVSMEFLTADPSGGRQGAQPHQFVVGDEGGTLHLLEVPKNLARQVPNEKSLVDALLKREQARIDYNTSRFSVRTES